MENDMTRDICDQLALLNGFPGRMEGRSWHCVSQLPKLD